MHGAVGRGGLVTVEFNFLAGSFPICAIVQISIYVLCATHNVHNRLLLLIKITLLYQFYLHHHCHTQVQYLYLFKSFGPLGRC